MIFIKKRSYLILLFVFLLGCAAIKPSTHHDIVRVHLVDYDKKNNVYLFRGSSPIVGGKEFAYDRLVQLMKESAKQDKNIDLPDDFYMIDFSLLFIERPDLSLERKFFQKNPNLGKFINYPVFGNIPDKPFFERISKEYLTKNINGIADNGFKILTELDIRAVKEINTLMTTPTKKPTVIYIHCEAGCDRTGEIVGAYRMQYNNYTIKEAYNQNTIECGRAENIFSKAALLEYCKYLAKKDCSF